MVAYDRIKPHPTHIGMMSMPAYNRERLDMNMMMPMLLPAAQMRLIDQFSRIAIESQMVIGMRMAGMMGLIPQDADENYRMIAEKQAAASESMFAMAKAGMAGASAERVMSMGLRPYGKRTRANSRRLTAGK
jgi:hypothetical protein